MWQLNPLHAARFRAKLSNQEGGGTTLSVSVVTTMIARWFARPLPTKWEWVRTRALGQTRVGAFTNWAALTSWRCSTHEDPHKAESVITVLWERFALFFFQNSNFKGSYQPWSPQPKRWWWYYLFTETSHPVVERAPPRHHVSVCAYAAHVESCDGGN